GITYGSMISKIGSLIGGASSSQNNLLQRELQISANANSTMMAQQFLGTVYMVIAIIATCFAITSLTRMVSEERHNRQEQLYALLLSRLKVFVIYTIIAWVLGSFAIFHRVFGVYF